MNPSKLPWTLREHPQLPCFIQGPTDPEMGYALEVFGDDYNGYGGREQRQADMEFAVKACNAHDQLVAALKLARRHLDWSLDGQEFRTVAGKIDKALAVAGVTL